MLQATGKLPDAPLAKLRLDATDFRTHSWDQARFRFESNGTVVSLDDARFAAPLSKLAVDLAELSAVEEVELPDTPPPSVLSGHAASLTPY